MTAYDLLQRPVVLLDFETTGLDMTRDRVIEVAAIRVGPQSRQVLSTVVRPDPVPKLSQWTIDNCGITQEMVENGADSLLTFAELSAMLDDDTVIIGHNIAFDIGFMQEECRRHGLPAWHGDFIDTRALATFLGKGAPGLNKRGKPYTSYQLKDVCQALGLSLEGAHRAEADLDATEQALLALWPMALSQYRPTVNAMVRPAWARPGEYTPPRAIVYLTA